MKLMGLQNWCSQTLDKSRDGAGRFFGRSSLNILFNYACQRATDHRRICELADCGKVLGVGDAKSHRYWQISETAQARDQTLRIACERLLCAGDAGSRYRIHESP